MCNITTSSRMLASASAIIIIYWYFNKHKTLKNIFRELRNTLYIQGTGVIGLIDDFVNATRNKAVIPDASKKVAVITGGDHGIGAEVIRGLLEANMTVIMGIKKPHLVKNMAKIFEKGENLHAHKLNLLSLKSVSEFATKVLNDFPEIHILINNAGVMYSDYALSEDGFESLLAVNHLGHFYLTHLLLPTLKNSGEPGKHSRIINVSSCVHYMGEINFDDINLNEYYDTTIAYSQAKLAQAAGGKLSENVPATKLKDRELRRVYQFKYLGHYVTDDHKNQTDIETERRALAVQCNMLARWFARCSKQLMSARYINMLLQGNGDRVKCYAVHPGVVDTDLINSSWWKKLFPWATKLVFKNPTQGAQPILHACFSKELENKGGAYISNCMERFSSRYSKNEDYQKKLFEISCELVKIKKYGFGN